MKKKRTGKRASKSFNRSVKWNGEWKLAGRKDHHHILPRCRNGKWDSGNILYLDVNVHKALNFLFGHLTLEEAGTLLLHISDMKKNNIDVDVDRVLKSYQK